MPRGFLVKRHYVPLEHHPDHLRYRDDDDDEEEDFQHHHGMFHPALSHYENTFPSSLYSNQNHHLHSLVERLGFDPHPLYFYSEPLTLSTPPPLDLSVKPSSSPITPPATPSPSSPVRKRPLCTDPDPHIHHTPHTPLIKYDTAVKSVKQLPKTTSPTKRTKAVRRLNFDEDKSSPVSGTIIRELRDDEEPLVVRKGDIDPAFNVVEVTEEAKAELAKIENKIGDYICRLCKEMYEDAFTLAQHRCSRIVHVEYRCPECDKVFNCPANLASHRRWHKPRALPGDVPHQAVDLARKVAAMSDEGDSNSASEDMSTALFPCTVCHKQFRRQAYLRKHLLIHQQEDGHPSYTSMPATYAPPLMRPSPPPSLMSTLSLHHHQVSAN